MGKYDELHIEQDFWDDFILEAFEHIEDIESNAMSLDKEPENMDIIHTMFRAFHTIKGLSGFVEHTVIQEIAHKTETMMDYCRKGELSVNTEIVDAILKSSDYIKRLCDDVNAYKDAGLISQIEDLLEVLERLAKIEEKVQEEVLAVEAEPEQIITVVEDEAEKEAALQAFADDFAEFVEPEQEEVVEKPKSEVKSEDVIEKTEVEVEPEPEVVQEAVVEENTEALEIETETVTAVEETIEEPIEELIEEPIEEPAEEPLEQVVEQVVEPAVELKAEPGKTETLKPEPTKTEIIAEEPKAVPAAPEEIAAKETGEQMVFETKISAEQKPEEKIEEKKDEVPENKELKAFQKDVLAKLKGTSQPVNEEAKQENPAVKSASANEEYMKVANYKIDHLVDMMGELIINQALIEQYVVSNYSEDKQLTTNMSGFLRITRELQNLSMSLRMVSLKPTFQKITRIARDTIQELKKDVEFVTSGDSTEIDRVVADKLLDPLVHLIKNAISHGVEENREDRIAAGKNPRAVVELNAYSKRGKIFIEIKDDGRGINTEIVYQKAVEKGLVDPSKTYSEAEIKEFIMLPGFSTAKVVDNISGRGVGMDVVKTQIAKTGGKVDIQSTLGKGSTFTLEVPVNNAIMNGTIIEMNEQQFVVPTINVKEFLKPDDSQWIFTKTQRTMIKVRDHIIPIVPISTFFKGVKDPDNVPLVMILELEQELRAVPIVNVLTRQEVVVKPAAEEFAHLKFISGMSILGTGKVSLILDIDYLFRKEVTE